MTVTWAWAWKHDPKAFCETNGSCQIWYGIEPP
jgi:hypothetical protein